MTVAEVIALLESAVPDMPKDGPLDGSNDTLKIGDAQRDVTGIVTTFLATADVMEKTASLGANLIITHEPTFYHHDDAPATFPDDPVIRSKVAALESHQIAVYRYHDYWHMHKPDGIYTGVVEQLGWQEYQKETDSFNVFTLPQTSLGDLAEQMKELFEVKSVQIAGPADALCQRVGLFVGSPPSTWHISSIHTDALDVLVCGEVDEWTVAEYVRDANLYGQNLGLIVVGHQPSEEAGMAYLAQWLQPKLPNLTITHVPSGFPLRSV